MLPSIFIFKKGLGKLPHIILTNVSDFESFFNNFKKDVLIIKNENNQTNTIIRFEEIFLNQLKNIILIRLDPLTDPKNKTYAVKTSLAYIAKQYKKIDPAISIGKTNLEQYLL
jgi:uncharacterized protein YjcR